MKTHHEDTIGIQHEATKTRREGQGKRRIDRREIASPTGRKETEATAETQREEVGTTGPSRPGRSAGRSAPTPGEGPLQPSPTTEPLLPSPRLCASAVQTLPPTDTEDTLLGAQLTAQWEAVQQGTRAQLVFGAMMLSLRARLDATRGADQPRGHARFPKGSGLKGWLAQYAPTVSESSAYRMMQVAEGLRDDLRLGKTFDLAQFLATAPETLPAPLAKKRVEIDRIVEGKSQRQLLVEFARGDNRQQNTGGFRPNALILRAWLEEHCADRPELLACETYADLPEEIQRRFRAEAVRYERALPAERRAELAHEAESRTWNTTIATTLHTWHDAQYYQRATRDQLTALDEALTDFHAAIRQHLRALK